MLSVHTSSLNTKNNSSASIDLTDALEITRGIYNSSRYHVNSNITKDLSQTVLVTACNYGYVHFLHNFDCFMKRLEFKYLVIAFDAKAHEYITSKTSMISYLWLGFNGTAVKTTASSFRSPQFNVITNRKEEAVHKIISLGYNVLFVDVDIALVRDPVPYVFWKNIDYVHSLNLICPQCNDYDFMKRDHEGNTGFYFVRSNNRTIKLWADAYSLSFTSPGLDDQTLFWNALRQSDYPVSVPVHVCRDIADNDPLLTPPYELSCSRLTGIHSFSRKPSRCDFRESTAHPQDREEIMLFCPLNGCMFSAGALRGVAYTWLADNLRRKHLKLHLVHANFIRGNTGKFLALKHFGYWLATVKKPTGPGLPATWGGECAKFAPKSDV